MWQWTLYDITTDEMTATLKNNWSYYKFSQINMKYDIVLIFSLISFLFYRYTCSMLYDNYISFVLVSFWRILNLAIRICIVTSHNAYFYFLKFKICHKDIRMRTYTKLLELVFKPIVYVCMYYIYNNICKP